MNWRLIATIIFCLPLFSVIGQTKDSINYSAYDLISNYYNQGFSPFRKGKVYTGLAFTLRNQQLENTQRLLDVVKSGEETNYGITLKGGYFIGNYVLAELDIIYSRDRFIGNLINQSGDSLYRQDISNSVFLNPNLKLFFPLSKNERLSFFNAIGFGIGFGQGLRRDEFSEDRIAKVYTDDFRFTLGVSPGITFFAIENFAFEVQLNNLIGYEFKRSVRTENETNESTRVTHNVNFNINLLSLQLGLAYFFGAKK